MYNTPPCWAIYMCGLVFNHMLRNGGIEANRSNMNVPFTIPSSQELEAIFVKEAAAAGMVSTLCLRAHPHPAAMQACTCMSTQASTSGHDTQNSVHGL